MKSIALLLALGLLFCSCSALSKEYPDKRYFGLKASRPGSPKSHPGDLVLKVRQFEASRKYEGQELVYRQGEIDWASDYYHVFFMPPADLATEEAIVWLKDTGLFAQVVPQTSRLKPTHYLEGYVVSLYGDYSDEADPRAVLELGILVIDEREAGTRVVLQRAYRREKPLPDNSVEELVRAYHGAFADILTELESDLSTALR